MNIISVDYAICQAFYYLNNKFNKGYVLVSQEKLIEILRKYYSVSISLRTLNYHLRKLENEGFITRKKRHARDEKGHIKFATTLTTLKKNLYSAIFKIGHSLRRAGLKLKKRITQYIMPPAPRVREVEKTDFEAIYAMLS